MEISIIVPVYNRGYCLWQCLDSIRNQSFTDWECILVDDGSTDDSFAICQEYEASDARFRAYHQKNGGVSAVLNKVLSRHKLLSAGERFRLIWDVIMRMDHKQS